MSSVVFGDGPGFTGAGEGSVQWIAKVPTVPPQEKNWYVDVSILTRSQGYQRKEWCVLKPSAMKGGHM